MKLSELQKISDPATVQRRFAKYKGADAATLAISNKPDKKYMVTTPAGKSIHFGSTLPDYTKHKDEQRRAAYLKRSAAIKGAWRDDKYSPNNLARELLW